MVVFYLRSTEILMEWNFRSGMYVSYLPYLILNRNKIIAINIITLDIRINVVRFSLSFSGILEWGAWRKRMEAL